MTRTFKLDPMPTLGITAAGQKVQLGGLSSLQFLKSDENLLYFFAMTDRGPNADEIQIGNAECRPFLLPSYAPSLLTFSIDRVTGDFLLLSHNFFTDFNGEAILGLPPKRKVGSLENELAVDIYGKILPVVNVGMDSEGFCLFQDTYIIADEYGPSLLQFNKKHRLINRWDPGSGLPPALVKRKKNRGFEALTTDGTSVFVMLQSPLGSLFGVNKEHAQLIQFDPLRGLTVKQFYYPLTLTCADKIGDLVWLSQTQFYVIEQSAKVGKKGIREIFHIDLMEATADGTLKKRFIKDLNLESLEFMEKIEGICKVDLNTIAVVMDNDYGLKGTIDFDTGLAAFNADPATYLALVTI